METVLVTVSEAVTREHGISLACNAFNQHADGRIAGVASAPEETFGESVTVAFERDGADTFRAHGPMVREIDGHNIRWEVME